MKKHSITPSMFTKLALLMLCLNVSACKNDNDKVNSNTNSSTNSTEVSGKPWDHDISETINRFMSRNHVPGMSVAVFSLVDGQEVVHNSGYGFANLAKQTEVDGNTAFWIGSVSKIVTGTAIMVAVENGQLSLDDEVGQLLSDAQKFQIKNPEKKPITIKHLVSHRSGIIDNDDAYQCAYSTNTDGETISLVNYFYDDEICPSETPFDLAGYLSEYLSSDGIYFDSERNFSMHSPGEQYQYTNVGAGLAGYTVELSTGVNLADYASANIFQPLAMHQTSWRYQDLNPELVATPYAWEENETDAKGGQFIALPNYELATWPDGGLRSSALDMSHFLLAVMQGGTSERGTILSNRSVSEMLAPIDGGKTGVFWGMGEMPIGNEKLEYRGHSGSDPGAFSLAYFIPERNAGFVLLANGDDDNVAKEDLNSLILLLMEKALSSSDL